MTLWNSHQATIEKYLRSYDGKQWNVRTGFGQSNSGRFIQNGLLLGVFNLNSFARWDERPIAFVASFSSPNGTDLYLTVFVDEEKARILEVLNAFADNGEATNVVRVYLRAGGRLTLQHKGFYTDADDIEGDQVQADAGTATWFSSAPGFVADRHVITSIASRFCALLDPSPCASIDKDSGSITVPTDESVLQLGTEPIMPVNSTILACLASKPFLILTGPSGTGKTRLMREMVHHLRPIGATPDFFHAFVPVEADWTDARHLLGYYNPFGNEGSGSYEITPVLGLLLRASLKEYARFPFFVILDEMNLSHVERYFARFLSLMETRGHGFGAGETLLSASELEAARASTEAPVLRAALDQALEEGGLVIPPNVFFVGTVNVDETTYMFSPKVLDRAFVYEFRSALPSELTGDPATKDVRPRLSPRTVADFILAHDPADPSPISIANEADLNSLNAAILGIGSAGAHPAGGPQPLLDTLHGILDGMGFPVAGRPTREVERLVYHRARLAPIVSDGNLTQTSAALDAILLTKLLPKVHGGRSQVRDGLVKLDAFCGDQGATEAAWKIERMLKQLHDTGYCSYIS